MSSEFFPQSLLSEPWKNHVFSSLGRGSHYPRHLFFSADFSQKVLIPSYLLKLLPVIIGDGCTIFVRGGSMHKVCIPCSHGNNSINNAYQEKH